MGMGGGRVLVANVREGPRYHRCESREATGPPHLTEDSDMTIATEKTASATIVLLQGQINSANAAGLETEILALVEGGVRALVLEFGALDYISSAGLRMVLVLAKRLKAEGGRLVLCGMQPHVREVFDISGFLSILNVESTRAEALARFG